MPSTAQERLAAQANLSTGPVVIGITASTQTSHTKKFTIAVTDVAGEAVEAAVRLRAQWLDGAALLATTSVATLAETGSGAEVSTTAKPSLIIDTSAAGAAEISVTDVVGSGMSGYLLVEPLNRPGASQVLAATLS